MKNLTAKYVRSLLDYDQATGVLRWRERPSSMFKMDRDWITWNGRYAGKVAGCVAPIGYRYISIDHKLYLAHRIIWLIVKGKLPPDGIDHINGGRADNRFSNLRLATHLENVQNQKKYSSNSSGYQGVSWNKKLMKWDARISHNKQQYFIGYFDTAEDASMAYLSAKKNRHRFSPLPQSQIAAQYGV